MKGEKMKLNDKEFAKFEDINNELIKRNIGEDNIDILPPIMRSRYIGLDDSDVLKLIGHAKSVEVDSILLKNLSNYYLALYDMVRNIEEETNQLPSLQYKDEIKLSEQWKPLDIASEDNTKYVTPLKNLKYELEEPKEFRMKLNVEKSHE